MCDDLTAHDADAALAARGLTRRDFAALSGAAALIGCTGASEPPLPPLGERSVSIPTSDGVADAFLVHPPQGAHPGMGNDSILGQHHARLLRWLHILLDH